MEDDREGLGGRRSAGPGDLRRNAAAAGILRGHHGAIFIAIHCEDELWGDSATASATTSTLSTTTASATTTGTTTRSATLRGCSRAGALGAAASRRSLCNHDARHNGHDEGHCEQYSHCLHSNSPHPLFSSYSMSRGYPEIRLGLYYGTFQIESGCWIS